MSAAFVSEAPWPTKRLKFCASYNDEVLPESTYDFEPIQYIEISDVSLVGGIEKSAPLLFHEAPSRARRRVRRGDILVSTVRTYLKAIAAVNEAPDNLIASTGFCVVRPNDGLDAAYAGWVTKSEEFVSEVVSRSVGVSYPAINASQLVDIEVPLPPIETQKRIAAFLDEKTAQIDGLIEKKRALLDRLAEKRQAIITRAVTKGLDAAVPMKDSGIDWLGQTPAHWEVKRVKHIAKLESGHTPDKKIDEYWENGDIPWVSLNDTAELRANDYIADTKFKTNALGIANSSARLLPPRAVVFTRDATIGESAITTRPMAVSQHLIAWICDQRVIAPEYLLLLIYGMVGELLRLTNGATIGTIGLGDVKELRVCVPPMGEQLQIVEWVFDLKERIDRTSSIVEAGQDRLTEYRSALITAAVTGQIEGLR